MQRIVYNNSLMDQLANQVLYRRRQSYDGERILLVCGQIEKRHYIWGDLDKHGTFSSIVLFYKIKRTEN